MVNINENKQHTCNSALGRYKRSVGELLRKLTWGRERILTGVRAAQHDLPIDPLDQLKEYLFQHGLSGQVYARVDNVTGDFILEDADGVVHAKDYAKAVAFIQRMWL